ncbi:MAG: hypothetical protein ABW087_20920 [Candidatus Thiodiazotropha sp.]
MSDVCYCIAIRNINISNVSWIAFKTNTACYNSLINVEDIAIPKGDKGMASFVVGEYNESKTDATHVVKGVKDNLFIEYEININGGESHASVKVTCNDESHIINQGEFKNMLFDEFIKTGVLFVGRTIHITYELST